MYNCTFFQLQCLEAFSRVKNFFSSILLCSTRCASATILKAHKMQQKVLKFFISLLIKFLFKSYVTNSSPVDANYSLKISKICHTPIGTQMRHGKEN